MLETYGWSDALRQDFAPHQAHGLAPARVILQQRGLYGLMMEGGEHRAEISARLAREAPSGGYPVVGDWVAVDLDGPDGRAMIQHVLPRATAFTRQAAGPAGVVQVVAANVDVAFITASLNGDLNPRRLERYLSAAWQSGAAPVVLLTKADLSDNAERARSEVAAHAPGAPVHAVSVVSGEGMEAVEAYLTPRRTAVLVGSSGVGKSTLVNALLGEGRMTTQAIREDDSRGRHTTSHRELILLPGGGLLLDTPGMREFALWDGGEGLAATFEDIEALARGCRFVDCGHGNEPGCAVRAALDGGVLEEGRWRGYQKLQRELAFQEAKEDPAVRAAGRRRRVEIAKANRARTRSREW